MGTVIIGKCQCQCYINYVSCDCDCQENEIRTERRVNRFTENDQKKRKMKKSVGESMERLSVFSSTRKPSSRSNSQPSKYLKSDECNINSDESPNSKIKRKPKLHPQFIKSRKLYDFKEPMSQAQIQIVQTKKIDYQSMTNLVNDNKSQIPKKLNNNRSSLESIRPFKKANQYQQLFFK